MASLRISLIAKRRNESGLSQRALARAIGVGEHTIHLLESRTNGHEDHSLRFVRRLADALGVSLTSLIDEKRHQEPAETGDIARVLAAIMSCEPARDVHRDDITWSLGWTTKRTEAALSAAADLLPSIGLRLQVQPGVGVRIVSSTDSLTDLERSDLLSALAARDGGMTGGHVRELRRIARGDFAHGWRQHASQNVLMTVGGLLKRGLAETRDDGSVSLSADTTFSLLLRELDGRPIRRTE